MLGRKSLEQDMRRNSRLQSHSLNPDFPKANNSGLGCQGGRNPEVSSGRLQDERTLKQESLGRKKDS